MNNDIVIEAWNTVLFDKFCRFHHLLVAGLSSHSDEIFSRAVFSPGDRVLDIGCGFGDSTVKIAKLVGPTGEARGVDCASNFIALANQLAEKENAANASFFIADVEHENLQGPYDHAFARFGTMFFTFPGAAMGNILRALVPGGKLTMIVWRKREDNLWLYDAEKRVRDIVPVIDHNATDQVHCGPGPFSMAGPDMVSDMLTGVGYNNVCFERFDSDICIGRDLNEAVEFAMALGPAGEIIRLAGEQGEALKDDVRAALTDELAKYCSDQGVWAPSSTWFVTAKKPV